MKPHRLFLWSGLLLLLLASLACDLSSAVVTATVSPVARVAPTASFAVPATEAAIIPMPTLDDKRTVCTDALNVRTGPGMESFPVAWLRRGEIVHVLESRDGWVRVGVGQWVKGMYLC